MHQTASRAISLPLVDLTMHNNNNNNNNTSSYDNNMVIMHCACARMQAVIILTNHYMSIKFYYSRIVYSYKQSTRAKLHTHTRACKQYEAWRHDVVYQNAAEGTSFDLCPTSPRHQTRPSSIQKHCCELLLSMWQPPTHDI
jgi:hypothetical protein